MTLRRAICNLAGAAIFSIGSASAAVLQQVAPSSVSYLEGTDFLVMTFSAVGSVTGSVTPVDLAFGLGNISSSGCDAADFAGFPAGNIALIQRGTCTFELKAENAALAGATGVLIFNQGNTGTVDRMGVLSGTLTEDYTGGLAVLGLPYDLGVELANTFGLVVHMQVTQADVTPATEPGSLLLIGIALAGLGARRRF